MKQAITVCAFIHKDGKMFAPRRAAIKSFLPNKFELPGGHVENGEDVIEALKREIKEEFGADICVGDAYYSFTYYNNNKETHSIEVEYFAKFIDENAIKLDPKEHSEYRWLSKEEAVDLWSKEDAEYAAVLKGFELLGGGKIDFC